MTSAKIPPAVFNERQAAEYLRVSRSTLKRWRQSGEGPKPIQYNMRGIRYRLSDLDKFLEERSHKRR